MFLELVDLEKRYDKENGVSDIRLSVEQGEFVTLLGPSGCGKTTILNLIGGFLAPDRGSILLGGEDITTLPPESRPVSTVFQSYALFPHMTVYQNIVYGLRVQRLPKAEIARRGDEMLEIVGLTEYRNRSIGQLSGGQQQRVALARSLVLNPKLLLLDEPLSNLDAKLRVKMREELKEIQAKFGITMLFVTHDQEEALTLSDRIVVLDRGRIRQIGTPEAIYSEPADAFVADFIGRVNFLSAPGYPRIIRPENLCFVESVDFVPAGRPQPLAGHIVGTRFAGAYRTHLVALQDPHVAEVTTLQIDVPLREDVMRQAGERVLISIR